MQLAYVMKADGRWRIFIFASQNDSMEMCPRTISLCNFFADSNDSPIQLYTQASKDIDSVIDIRVIFQQSHLDLDLVSAPYLLRPVKGRLGLTDYEKIFCPDIEPAEGVFDVRGIDRAKGCMVVVRPDQQVAQVLPLNAYEELSTFFANFMIPVPLLSVRQ